MASSTGASGVSTLGARLGYGATKGTYTFLSRVNSIGGISLEPEQIDSSALEDFVSRYVPGRSDNGGTLTVTVNLTDSTITEWETVISTANGGALYWEIYFPNLAKAFVVKAYPPAKLPSPEVEQNGLLTVEINLTIEEYIGVESAVAPSTTT